MADIRVTKPDTAYLDVYQFGNTTTDLINGIVVKEVQIYPRKFSANFCFAAFPFDVTVAELKEKFGSDTKVWAYFDIEWLDATYGGDSNRWHYDATAGTLTSQSVKTLPSEPNYTHYVMYIPDTNQTTGKIKANIPFLMHKSQQFNPSEQNPLVFYDKTFVVPETPLYYGMGKGMYMFSNMHFLNGDVCSMWNLNDIVKRTLDTNKPYFILNNANTGEVNYFNAASTGAQCTGAGMFKVKEDSGWY